MLQEEWFQIGTLGEMKICLSVNLLWFENFINIWIFVVVKFHFRVSSELIIIYECILLLDENCLVFLEKYIRYCTALHFYRIVHCLLKCKILCWPCFNTFYIFTFVVFLSIFLPELQVILTFNLLWSIDISQIDHRFIKCLGCIF